MMRTLQYFCLVDRKRLNTIADQQQYVKKPVNTYMLFLIEQRPQVKAEIKSEGINTVLTYQGAQVRELIQCLVCFILPY